MLCSSLALGRIVKLVKLFFVISQHPFEGFYLCWHLIIYSCNNFLLSGYYMTSKILSARNIVVKKIVRHPAYEELTF